MRAFKQFLSLVLVTCMLTSMFAVVSAKGPTMGEQVWDSDSGHVTIAQGEKKVDSAYYKDQDSGYTVEMNLDAEEDVVQLDLSSGADQVTVAITAENLEETGTFDLKVYDTGRNVVYVSEEPSQVGNNGEVQSGSSDNQKIEFTVPPIAMAGGSMLGVYPAGTETPAWEISYQTEVTGNVTASEDEPAKIVAVSGDAATGELELPAAAVEAVMNNVSGNEAYVEVSVTSESGKSPALYLSTSIFKSDNFTKNSNFSLNVVVVVDEKSYTWTFSSKAAQKMLRLAKIGGSDEEMDLNPTVVAETFGENGKIEGEKVTIDASKLSDTLLNQLTVPTTVFANAEQVQIFSHEGETWVDSGAVAVKNGSVTFTASKAAVEYAIVPAGTTADEMNFSKEPGETTTEYAVVVTPEAKSLELSQEKPTGSIEIQVQDTEGTVLDSGAYTVEWESSDEKVVTVVKDSNYKGKGAQGTVTAHANTSDPATVTATITLKDTTAGLFSNETKTETVEITVTATGFDVTEPDPTYQVTVTPETLSLEKGQSKTLTATVTENGVTMQGATVTWTTSDDKVATVNKDGVVTAVAGGDATITATYVDSKGVSHIATAEVTVTETVTPEKITITLKAGKDTIKVNETTTITATVSGAEYKDLKWSVTGDAALVSTSSDNKTVTIKGTAVGPATVTATIGDVSSSCKITVEKSTSGGSTSGGSSSGGSNSGTAMPNTGSSTTTTPGTGTTNPGTGSTSGNAQPQGCVSDTVGNFSINGAYQYKLTSTNGTAPVVTVSNSNFRVVLASQNGNDYFYKVYAIGAPGQTCDVYVNGTKVSTVTASSVYGGVMSDTTAPFTVKKGGSYQFKLTASSQPTMAAGSSSFRVEYVGNSGNDWFFKVYATGNAGDGCGFYVNGAPFTVAVAHIAE